MKPAQTITPRPFVPTGEPSLNDQRARAGMPPINWDEPIVPPPSLAWRVLSVLAVLASIGGSALAVWLAISVLRNW